MSATNDGGRPRILVIKLAALGDVVQALGPMAAIRRHHADAHITLLTTAPYADFLRASGCFDEIWTDSRPKARQVAAWLALRRRLRAAGFARVYDLQTSDRSAFHFRLFWPGPWPEWSGVARGCTHPHANPSRDLMHTLERQADQLAMAGIADVPAPALPAAAVDLAGLGAGPFHAVLAPGGAPHRPDKRWPTERFAEIARRLAGAGVRPLLVGAASEAALLEEVRAYAPDARSLAGRTTLLELAALAKGAAVAVGNDTGPMHLAATAGTPTVVLYSRASDPALCAQRGRAVTILRRPSLIEISVDEAWAAVEKAMLAGGRA